MKSRAKWIENYKSIVDNGRNFSMVMDLPEDSDGDDMGPTALEVSLMGLAGCISTIYKVVANKMRLGIAGLTVELDAEKPDDADTITSIVATVKVDSSEEPFDKLKKCLDQTLKTCPVGLIFEGAGVNVNTKLVQV